jgi:uncharacterized protein (TIGR03067 family)
MRRLIGLLFLGLLLGAQPPRDDAGKKDLGKMQGDWAAVSMIQDGQPIPDDDAQALFRTMKGQQYSVAHFRRVIGKGTFTLDATKTPHAIDAFPANLPDKTKPVRGIYAFEGERLKLCFALPGKERPSEFSSKEGSGHTLSVWEREKK